MSYQGKLMIIQGTEDNFVEEVLKAAPYVLVYFTSDWSDILKKEDIIVKQIAEEYENKIKVVQFDIKECPNMVKFLNIINIPNFRFYDRGELLRNLSGAYPIEELRVFVNQAISGKYHIEKYRRLM